MAAANIVVHYHELWLKGGNRDFFLSKLRLAMRRALDGLRIARITEPGDRYVIELLDEAELPETLRRLARVSGIANLAVARAVERDLENPLGPLCAAAWEEVRNESFASFAVRAKRSDKRFPINALTIEREVGGYLHDQLQGAGRSFRVDLRNPELTCRIEITPGPVLVYARRIPGAGGLPANTAGRLTCLLSGGFDSSVAAWKMMRRGAHVNFVHFWGGGAKPGESSVHVARELVKRLVPWQFTAKLYLVPFEPLQREIMREAPEQYRILLYRRLMLRIAERVARGGRSLGLVTGDSLAQVASQTLQNMAAVGAATHMPLYRPLVGDDKLEILEIAKKIGTHDISAEPFHDCCPVFLPKAPALFATAQELEAAEAALNVEEMVRSGLQTLSVERYRYTQGRVIQVESLREATA
ncbi:MAG: tRNA 4-thiouridine(8) synthase ThiI [Acidobacteriia bacterium]|nr:tRNA 4-thiouridine(8) synthase ThiI [Terriglobia bacterium]